MNDVASGIRRLRFLLEGNDGGVWGEEAEGDGDSIVLRSTEQSADGHWRIDEPARRKLSNTDRRRFRLKAGDVLVTKSSGSAAHIGKATLVDEDVAAIRASYSNFMQRLRPGPNLEPRYLWYCMRSSWVRQQLQMTATTSTGLGNLTGSQIGDIGLPDLDLGVQRAIADYLDRETAQIDAFIAKNEELVGLLIERRSAAIDDAITGRSSSNEKQTHSKWFGVTPGHWRQLPVKGLAREVTDGAHISPDTENGLHDFVSTRDVTYGVIDFEGSLKTSSESFDYMVRTGCRPMRGDVLFSKDGTIGTTAVVSTDHSFVVASSLVIVRPKHEVVHSRFLSYALSARPIVGQAGTMVRGAGIPRLSVANLARVTIPVPPLNEQAAIVDRLDEMTHKTGKALTVAHRSIALARERRSALISAAVTGKIDIPPVDGKLMEAPVHGAHAEQEPRDSAENPKYALLMSS